MRALLALIVAVALPAATPPTTDDPTRPTPRARVGIWAPAVEAAGESFSNQTVRHVVYASSGGWLPRVRVSNLRGTTPLVVGHVDLAEQSIGGVAKTGSHRRVTFGGSGTVTIPAGEEWLSDPADMTVVSGQNLLISIYLPGATGPSTVHPAALTDTYVSVAGNHAADDSSADFSTPRRWSWFFLSGLDVASATATGTVVTFGDSITDGYSSSHLSNRRYPDYLARRLAAQPGGPKLGVVNKGMAGNMVLRDRTPAAGGRSALNRFDHDALGLPGVRSVILLEGVNDLMADVTAAQLQEGYRQLIAKAHARGVSVYGGTILPFGGASSHTAAREAVRQQVNTWIRTSGAFDGVFDFDAALRDPADGSKLLPAYAHTDNLHLTDAGMSALADCVDLSMIGT
ncbi:SGNH/GDSL hydrolase family protein [Micromonospora sp. LAH09]|uniref:SGNH/GDSL hydrolase family protein n=1 Tax=Micromonospora cabrerizensis TaxID=2911213 RepID=UPI001EE782BB|nr:SGNH/GDSL hydrolase family protein [Micromonospora cabrerizensis]MCG5470587.1 SGNH/GDSL hydrolase family protein [Micromonospora cabrerizensis]